MSLYKFFESFVEQNNDLVMINIKNPMNYNQIYDYYKLNNARRFPIQILFDKFFEETLINCSKSKREYDILKVKTLKISQNAQHMFNVDFALQVNNLLKEKNYLLEYINIIENK